jgi:GNAT superfamily N-acetyltransferase
MHITIRPALENEAAKLTAIAFASKRHWQYPEAWIELWSDELTVSREYIRSHAVFCANAANEVMGWYALSFSKEVCELDYIWVLPEKMGCGVGTAMMRHAKGVFSNSPAETMTVISDPNAEGFYLKMGFEKRGMHPSRPQGRMLRVFSLGRKKS